MPVGDCNLAIVHHWYASASSHSTVAHELPPRTELNHSSVAPDVVHTSRLGPAARYRGIRAVSTTERKRRVEGGSARG